MTRVDLRSILAKKCNDEILVSFHSLDTFTGCVSEWHRGIRWIPVQACCPPPPRISLPRLSYSLLTPTHTRHNVNKLQIMQNSRCSMPTTAQLTNWCSCIVIQHWHCPKNWQWSRYSLVAEMQLVWESVCAGIKLHIALLVWRKG